MKPTLCSSFCQIPLKMVLAFFFLRLGIIKYHVNRIAQEFTNDLCRKNGFSLRQKFWAYKRGFISDRLINYGINEHNHSNYISDFDYYKTTSFKNRRLSRFLDDKLAFRYLMEPFSQYLPKHYFAIQNGRVFRLPDLYEPVEVTLEGIIQFLKIEKVLMCKPSFGSCSMGITKLQWDGHFFYWNNRKILDVELYKQLSLMNDYIFTEYVFPNPTLSKINSNSSNAIRLIAVNDPDAGTQITAAVIRFGTIKTGVVDSPSLGGIICGVDLKDGSMFNPKKLENGIYVQSPVHPDSKIEIKGRVPNWNLVLQSITKIGNHFPTLPYMTYDLVVTERSFKILEVNSHGRPFLVQLFYPFFNNVYLRKLFSEITNN